MSFPKSLPASRIEPASEAQILRWGILGSGWIAERFIESVRAHTKQDIVAVGSRSKERAEKFASHMGLRQAYGDYQKFVEAHDLDVIYVATPHNLHLEGVTLALKAGKHVLVEKPIALIAPRLSKWWIDFPSSEPSWLTPSRSKIASRSCSRFSPLIGAASGPRRG